MLIILGGKLSQALTADTGCSRAPLSSGSAGVKVCAQSAAVTVSACQNALKAILCRSVSATLRLNTAGAASYLAAGETAVPFGMKYVVVELSLMLGGVIIMLSCRRFQQSTGSSL